MPSMQSTVILATTLLGSLLQHANAAATGGCSESVSKRADVKFPDCIATCMRNSGCFDSKCVCKSAADGILSDIVICMNQWCPADVTAKDLIGPLEGQCDLPKSAVQDAEKKGGIATTGGSADEEGGNGNGDEDTSSPKPTATPAPGGKGNKDDDSKDEDEEVVISYDVGKPQTNPAGPATTATTASPAISGTLTVPTDAVTTGLLVDEGATGSLGAATSTPATPSSSGAAAAAGKSGASGSSDNEDSAAGLAGQASIFGAVAAMGFALAMGF